MKLQYLILCVTFQTRALDIDVDGEVSFDLRIPPHLQQFKEELRTLDSKDRENNKDNENSDSRDNRNAMASEETGVAVKVGRPRSKVTVGPIVECMYQYPEQKQVNSIVSNMMNELTKVFVRAHDLMMPNGRRKQARFRVVEKKNTQFFENIYSNMTEEYLTFYNTTAERVYRSGRDRDRDPCQHQEEIKLLWKELLENSLVTFRRAALKCIEEHLKVQNRSTDARARGRLEQFLVRELSKVKSNQLDILCDNFQLCYNELL